MDIHGSNGSGSISIAIGKTRCIYGLCVMCSVPLTDVWACGARGGGWAWGVQGARSRTFWFCYSLLPQI